MGQRCYAVPYIAIQGNAVNEILYPNTTAAYSDLVAQTQSGMDAYLSGMVGQTGSGGLDPAGRDIGPLYFTITSAKGADVDEPGSVTILACGLLALAGVRRYLARGTGWRDAAALSTGEAMI
jgi:hypothetical protein